MSPLRILMDVFNVIEAKCTELLEFTASVVEATKSCTKDNLPTLSSTARAIAFLVAVGSLVIACLQWKNANKLAENANRLSLMAICEEFPHRQHDPECKSLLDSALPSLSLRSPANISAPVNQSRPSDTLFVITAAAAAYLCVLLAVVWVLRSRHRRRTLEVDPEQLAPLQITTCCFFEIAADPSHSHSVSDMRVRGGGVVTARVGHRYSYPWVEEHEN